ncbi:Uncharacterised protein [Serratia quinivorans]|nr:Uncharacterised protein [Serratia quinivorans]CAI2119195.1 Uncharacterised protein [Serratia quinivorans]
MWVFLFPIKKALFIIHNTLMHHWGVRIELIGTIHKITVSNPLNLKLVVTLIVIIRVHAAAQKNHSIEQWLTTVRINKPLILSLY